MWPHWFSSSASSPFLQWPSTATRTTATISSGQLSPSDLLSFRIIIDQLSSQLTVFYSYLGFLRQRMHRRSRRPTTSSPWNSKLVQSTSLEIILLDSISNIKIRILLILIVPAILIRIRIRNRGSSLWRLLMLMRLVLKLLFINFGPLFSAHNLLPMEFLSLKRVRVI